MAYEGPGKYRHYKGSFYNVFGLGLKEDTVTKPNQPEHADAGPELQCVVYQPISAGSILEDREEKFWLRERSDFDAKVTLHRSGKFPRFRKIETSEGCDPMANYTQHWNCRICYDDIEIDRVPKHCVCGKCLSQIAEILCIGEFGLRANIDTPGIDKSYWIRKADQYVNALMMRWKPINQRKNIFIGLSSKEVQPVPGDIQDK